MHTWPLVIFISIFAVIFSLIQWKFRHDGKNETQSLTILLTAYGIISSSIIILLLLIAHIHSLHWDNLKVHLHWESPLMQKKVFTFTWLHIDAFSVIVMSMTFGIFMFTLIKGQLRLRKLLEFDVISEHNKFANSIKQKHSFLEKINLIVIPDKDPIAFSFTLLTLLSKQKVQDYIIISKGMIDILEEDELTGVLAHEYGHLSEHHTRYAHIIVTLANTFKFDPILWVFRKIINERHEILADYKAVQLTNQPRALASSLFKVLEINVKRNAATSFFSNNKNLLIKRIKILIQLAEEAEQLEKPLIR